MNIILSDKEAVALASIMDFHERKTNMSSHCTEVVARRACKKIWEQIGDREVRISNEDMKEN